ncbi:MAG: hypothetical protein ACTSR3_23015, partial [Candidatus Helarchaeota archaeon]
IICLFGVWAVYSIIWGITAITSPFTIIENMWVSGMALTINLNPFLSAMFGVNPLNGQPLLGLLPYLGVLFILLAVLLIIDIYGLLALKEWGWVITAIICVVLIFLIIGIVLLWILDEEKVKIAYNQL